MDDYLNYNDLESLLGDITSEDLSLFETEMPIVVEIEENKKGKRRKKKRNTSYNQVAMRQSDSSMIAVFTPKIVRSDIRRSYSSMIANVLNSGDFPLMYGLLETFFVPTFEHCVIKQNPGDMRMQSFVRQGLNDIATSFYAFMHMDPDPRVTLKDTTIHLISHSTASKIVTEWSFSATSIYQRDEEERAVTAISANESTASNPSVDCVDCIECECDKNDDQSATESNAYEVNDTCDTSKLATIARIVDSIEAVKKTFPLRKEPLPFTLGGRLVLYTDENKVITRMEMEMLAPSGDAGSQSQLNLVQPTLARFGS